MRSHRNNPGSRDKNPPPNDKHRANKKSAPKKMQLI